MSSLARYGHFNDNDGTFVLTAPPPRKWVNIHYNAPGEHEVYAEITNIGDGPIVVRDGPGNVCNLVSYDSKYLYVRDDDTNTAFGPGGGPTLADVADCTVTYHAAYTRLQGTCAGLRATQRVFVPRDEVLEAWTVTVENLTDKPRRVSVFAYAMLQLNGSTWEGKGVWKDNASAILPDLGAVLVTNRHEAVPTDRYKGYVAAVGGFHAATGYRDHFTHADFCISTPRLLRGGDLDNRVWFGPDCAGAVQVKFTLPPRGSRRCDFLIGQTSGRDELAATLRRVTPARLDAACDEQVRDENERARAYRIDTGHAVIDGITNHFSKKQMVSYLINKSGYRDNLQNDMGLAMADYPLVRANLLRALASQYPTGDVPHGFRPLNLLPYADKPAWTFHCIPWVIKESGDLSLLQEVVPYFRSDEKGTVWDHMVRAMHFLANCTGIHGLCDQRFADWDDGLEPSEKTGRRESVMVTQQLCLGLLEMAELGDLIGERAVADEARRLHADFTRRLNEHAWDGAWYQRTLCEFGYTAGTQANEEGRLFLYCQAWAVLSQTAPGDRARQCLEAVDRLCENEIGFPLIVPPFSRFDERIGKISSTRPWYATNGGSYCHAVGFKVVADCMLGRAEEAWRAVQKTAPDSPWNPLERSLAEPFSWTNCYDLVPEKYGVSQYPWRTGTASWFTMAILEWILGLRRHHRGLLVSPCLSRTVPRARAVRHYRGARYEVEIDNTAGRCVGAREIRLDGRTVDGNLLPIPTAGAVHRLHIVI